MATPFESYNLHYLSGGTAEALINLFHNRVLVGVLTFHKDGTELPPNVSHEDGAHAVHYHISRFRDVLHILQFEKPLHLRVNDGVANLMAAGFEPVGEQEGHGSAAR
jgi:hypothetical protein